MVTLSSVVQNNVVQAGNSAIVLFNEAGSTIQGNTVTGSGYSGIDIYYSNDNSIEANEIYNSSLTAIRLRGSHGNLVEGNDGSGDGLPDIQQGEGSDDNTILNNFPAVQPVPARSPLVLCGVGGGVLLLFGWLRRLTSNSAAAARALR